MITSLSNEQLLTVIGVLFGVVLILARYSLTTFNQRITELNQRVTDQAAALEKNKAESASALSAYKEKAGMTFTQLSERVQALETNQKNSINHEDLSAVHRRVDEVHGMLSGIGKAVSRVEGLLEGMTLKANNH